MTTRPGFIWSGSEWVAIGQEAVVAPVSYQTSAPSTPSTGDIWIDSNDDVPGIDTSQFLRWRKTMAGGETSVSGTDDNGLTLTYTPNYEQVYLNGVLLVRGQDYTATNGTSITGLTALAANDVVEVYGVVARVVGDVYTQAQTNSLLDAKSNVSSTGLVLLNTTEVTTATAQIDITNVFSSSYTNYKITFDVDATVSENICFRLLDGTTPASTTYDTVQRYQMIGDTGELSSANGTYAILGYAPSGGQNIVNLELFKPALPKFTLGIVQQSRYVDASVYYIQRRTTAIQHRQTTSYSGFRVFIASGNITGTIKVYGYK